MPNALRTENTGNFYFHASGRRTCRDGDLHYHNQLEIYYLLHGSCRYFIDARTYLLQAGDLVIIPAGVLHTVSYAGQEHARYLINCELGYIPPSVRPRIGSMTYICRVPSIREEIESIFEKIGREYAGRDAFSEDAKRCDVAALMILLARAQTNRQTVDVSANFVEAAVSYMQRNYADPIALSDVAQHCSVSSEHLSRMFKKNTGFGFCEYLTLYRLKQAETMLLEQPDLAISQVAYRCGFNDSNYFSCRFRKLYGFSPSDLRREGGEALARKISLFRDREEA